MFDPVQLIQRCLDFPEFDAVAANLHLLIGAPQVLELAVGVPPHQVAGAVHALPRRPERARHEPGSGQTGPADVAVRQTGAGHVQLANHAGRHRLQPDIEHKEGQMCQRSPDGADHVVSITGGNLPERRVHRRLGNPIHVDHPRQTRMFLQP
ncbi:hypothetical protein BOO86_03095 [Mycobacterium sp. CBMA 234]|nr:hypothetical protein [Mycolicibacterium sp. CBMA 234]